jgi:2',3'-cyclic-nucleotide 2'-phosphodiesterase (5'-nucleotidase family)
MKLSFLIILGIIFSESVLAQDGLRNSTTISNFTPNPGKNYPLTNWNIIVGVSEVNILSSDIKQSIMNNFICDAMLEQTSADFVCLNYGEITTDLYHGEITQLDLFSLCPFNRTLVVFKMTGDYLRKVVERNIAGFRSGFAIAGGKIEYNISRPSGNRLTYFQVGDHPLYLKKEYHVVTTDYLADGNAGFEMLTSVDSSNVFRTGILLRDAIGNYIKEHTPLDPRSVSREERWTKK